MTVSKVPSPKLRLLVNTCTCVHERRYMRDPESHFLQDASCAPPTFVTKNYSPPGASTNAALLCNVSQRVSDDLSLSYSLLGRPCLLTPTSRCGHQGGHYRDAGKCCALGPIHLHLNTSFTNSITMYSQWTRALLHLSVEFLWMSLLIFPVCGLASAHALVTIRSSTVWLVTHFSHGCITRKGKTVTFIPQFHFCGREVTGWFTLPGCHVWKWSNPS